MPTFSFGTRGAKEKVIKKKTPRTFRSLRRATKGSAFGNRKLLKKLDQNFPAMGPTSSRQLFLFQRNSFPFSHQYFF
ncbi:MAG: hypothetical protein E7625_06610 [Ruminococcaceae bacterium]|nr:hypothetical protein [Oscillospiraceae bacterium]